MLKLYKNKTPNANGKHYYFSNFNNYLTALGQPFMEFELHNYEINENTIVVQMNEEDAIDITYIVDYRTNYKRCYSVDFMNYQNGMALFSCNVDYWGSYIADANIHNIRVTRCNRNIGVGVYDKIAVTTGLPQYLPLYEFTNDSFSHAFNPTGLLVTISFTIRQGDGINPTVTALKTYYFATNQITYLQNPTIYDLIDFVSGIFANNAPAGMFSIAKSNVISAYLIDDYCVDAQYKITSNLPEFESRVGTVSGTTTQKITPLFEIKSHIFNFVTRATDYNSQFEVFVGTRHNNLKITRTTNQQNYFEITFEFLFNYNGLQVFVKQGAISLDITNAFRINLTTNEGVAQGQKHIADTLAIIGSAGAIASGNLFLGTLGFAGTLNSITPDSNGGISAGGDGACELLIDNPFVMSLYESTDDESAHARLYGANFNQQINSLNELTNHALLGYGTLTDTYVKCDAFVDNVPTLAQNEILSKLNNGVYLEFLDV